ncbi:MAG: ACP phosphodiesterase [bacterium]|nr:MAG: ACP phosphodiesterase [bacterium]
MNLLAHAHLSGDNEKLLAGNLIADAVKGKNWLRYSPDIRLGILLHRKIDDFTDKHPLVRQSKAVIREHYGLYSGVVTDIYFDHFLAVEWKMYSDTSLVNFSRYVYGILSRHFTMLPPRIKYILPFMIAQNWLNSYASSHELKRIFYNMDRRTGFRSGMKTAVSVMETHYETLQQNFRDFYPQLERRAEEVLVNA